MKLLFTIFLLLCCIMSMRGGDMVFALTGLDAGSRNLLDTVQTQLTDSVNFVERQEVSALLEERLINQQFGLSRIARQMTGADIFVAVHRNIMTCFETENGFRLVYCKLPGDFDRAARTVKSAIEKLNSSGKDFSGGRMISPAGVRNNVPYIDKDRIKKISSHLDFAVNSGPALVLEREYLAELLLEKELSNGWKKAVGASEIVHFELNPGSDEQEIIIAAYTTDPAGKVSFRAENTDMKTVLQAFYEHCAKEPETTEYTLKDEARRFDREARIAGQKGHSLQALKLQFAAFALAPESGEYFKFNVNTINDINQYFPYCFAALKKLPRLMARDDSGELRECTIQILRNIWYQHHDLPDLERRQYWAWLEQNRSLWLNGTPVNRFRNAIPELYPSWAGYRQAKENEWQKVLSSSPAPEDFNTVAAELLKLQKAYPPGLRRQWTVRTAETMRKSENPFLEITARMLECHAFLHTPECTVDEAVKYFEELAALAGKYPEVNIYPSCLYDYKTVNTYPGLLKKVRNMINSLEK